jgi:hypothetical protein
MTQPSDILPRQHLVVFQPEPDGIRQAYRTIADKTCVDLATFDAKVRQRLDAIEAAARAERLWVESRLNALTGAQGVIVGSDHPDSASATAIAELLHEPEHGADAARGPFEWLGWLAATSKLSAVAYEPATGGSRITFLASMMRRDDEVVFDVLARLLVTEAELSQWPPVAAIDKDFRNKTVDELVSAFNGQVGNAGWTTSRSYYLSGLHKALLGTGLDCSSFIHADGSMSLRERIVRVGDRLLLQSDVIDFEFRPSDYWGRATGTRIHDVTIASILLASTGSDVISIQAIRRKGRIDYRVTDEYATKFRWQPTTSTQPLTLGQLVTLIDTCVIVRERKQGLVRFHLEEQVRPDMKFVLPRAELRDFIKVESEFYPALHQPLRAAD